MPASEYIKKHPAYRYASAIVSGNVAEMNLIPEVAAVYKAPSYVVKQCEDFLRLQTVMILNMLSATTSADRLMGF